MQPSNPTKPTQKCAGFAIILPLVRSIVANFAIFSRINLWISKKSSKFAEKFAASVCHLYTPPFGITDEIFKVA